MLRKELVHGEEGNFEMLYFVSVEVMESVYNEAVLELHGLLRQFQ